MLSPLADPVYRRLFLAQVLSLLGTGLATVALGLLAYQLAGADAGAVLGTALAIKMVAYVGVAPVAGAFANRLPRRTMLVALDLLRAAVALCLPFCGRSLAGLHTDLRVAGRLGRIHAHLPGHHPRRAAGRGRVY